MRTAAGTGAKVAGTLTVMTRNLYLGADLTPVLLARTAREYSTAVQDAFAQILATDFPSRARLLAAEIDAAQPDLVGLQEVALWRMEPDTADEAAGSGVLTVDFLEILGDALMDRGLAYQPVAISAGVDVRSAQNHRPGVRFVNRNVILARAGLEESGLLANPRTGNFTTNVEIQSPVAGLIVVTRGWAAVDVELASGTVRFVSVHLEDAHPDVQLAQATELLHALSQTALPVVLVGDFNVDAQVASVPTYAALIDAGFVDAWQAVRPGDPGLTCCQAADLRNPTSSLSQRIDLILVRGAMEVLRAKTTGSDPLRRTPAGLWASDHAGVVATLRAG